MEQPAILRPCMDDMPPDMALPGPEKRGMPGLFTMGKGMRGASIAAAVVLLQGAGWWYHDVGAWKREPSMALVCRYSSGTPCRTAENRKADADSCAGYSCFDPEECRAAGHRAVYDACLNLHSFDVDRCTCILSCGFTIGQRLHKGDDTAPRVQHGRTVHGTGCGADAAPLCRIRQMLPWPNPDRRDSLACRVIRE